MFFDDLSLTYWEIQYNYCSCHCWWYS